MMREGYEYVIKRSMRRTVMLKITPDARIEVLAPMKLPAHLIDAYVASKADWIEKNLAKAKERFEKTAAYQFQSLTFLGEEYPARLYEGSKVVLGPEGFLLPKGELSEVRAKVISWYKEQAKQILPKRAEVWAGRMGASPEKIKITSAKTRWGSCNAQGNVNFSWRLVLAPGSAVDYVVVHELTHLKVMSHNAEFWKRVGETYPSYNEAKKLLKDVQKKAAEQGF